MASEAQARQAELQREVRVTQAYEAGLHDGRLQQQRYEQHHGGEVKVVTDPAPRPFEDPRERRAFCLKSAIETKSVALSLRNDGSVAESAEQVLAAARLYEAYINGADSEAS